MIVRGFEKVTLYESDQVVRKPHDWDQDMTEGFVRSESDEWVKLYKAMDKQIVVVSLIGFSLGPEAYDKAVRGAIHSQFKSGLIELK